MAGEREWLLVDMLGDAPAVVSVGRKQTSGLPKLATFLGRNASLEELLAALKRVGEHVGEVRIAQGKKNQLLHISPVALPDGQVHGAQVWIGKRGENPPARPLAGAWWWDIARAVSVENEESFKVNALPGRYKPRKSIAADLKLLVDPHDELNALGFVLAGEPGDVFDTVWTHENEEGHYVFIRFSAHISMDEDGGRHVRGVSANVDVDPNSWLHPRPTMIAQVARLAASRQGVHCALMLDPRAFKLWRWWNDPPPWLGDIYEPQLHPDDLPALLALIAGLRAGQGEADPAASRHQAVLRLMGTGGDWLRVKVEADLAPLGVIPGEFAGRPIAAENSALLRFKLVEGGP